MSIKVIVTGGRDCTTQEPWFSRDDFWKKTCLNLVNQHHPYPSRVDFFGDLKKRSNRTKLNQLHEFLCDFGFVKTKRNPAVRSTNLSSTKVIDLKGVCFWSTDKGGYTIDISHVWLAWFIYYLCVRMYIHTSSKRLDSDVASEMTSD